MQNENVVMVKTSSAAPPDIAPLDEKDLPEAERIFRVAFGTFVGAPDPDVFWADRDYVYGRHRAPHVAAFGATIDGNLVGSNFATKWGSVGFFGPITVRPDLQERGNWQELWSSSTLGRPDMSGCLPSHRARSTLVSIRSMVFTRVSSQQSCQCPLAFDQVRAPDGLASAI